MRLTFLVGALALAALGNAQIICLDPGHPSEVGIGTQGRKTTEVKVVWEVAQALRKQLVADGYRVVMTKSALMEKVRNRKRADIANRSGADLLLRLHCDASTSRGFAVYYPSQKGRAEGVTGPSLDVLSRSKVAATALHAAMAKTLDGFLPNDGLKTDLATAVGAKQGALTGSIFSKVPVVLIELVVLTNPKDEAFIVSKAGRQKVVQALRNGLVAAVPRNP